MKTIIAMMMWLLGLPTMAQDVPQWLPQTWGVHTYSYHFDGKQPEGSLGWNNNNLGIYARYDFGLTGGTYENSIYRRTWYIGWTFDKVVELGPVQIDVFVGLGTGYDKVVDGEGDRKVIRCESVCREVSVKDVVSPMVVPSIPISLADNVKARAHAGWSKTAGYMMHLSFEYRR